MSNFLLFRNRICMRSMFLKREISLKYSFCWFYDYFVKLFDIRKTTTSFDAKFQIYMVSWLKRIIWTRGCLKFLFCFQFIMWSWSFYWETQKKRTQVSILGVGIFNLENETITILFVYFEIKELTKVIHQK
jgi:hypothetical protein